jgi:hypothetical protein
MKNLIVNRVFDYAIDKERTEAYLEFIKTNVSGKTVVELGSGSGIMTWLCVKYGATHVYAYENNKRVLNWLKTFFKDEAKVTIVEEDITTATLKNADIYLHENFGSNVYMENILGMYANLKAQNLEDKTYPNKLKMQYGTYDISNSTEVSVEDRYAEIDDSDLLEFFALCPMDEIMPGMQLQRRVNQNKVTINGTLFDGNLKDLTLFTASDTNDELVFWEATFDGQYTLSNWKSTTSWNIIPIDRIMNMT